MSMTFSTPITYPDNWEPLGDMYEDFDYKNIVRIRPAPLLGLAVEKILVSGTDGFVKNRLFKFAYRYIYKDSQVSPMSMFSEPYVFYTNENKNAFRLTAYIESSYVKYVEFLVNINNNGWVIADKVKAETTNLVITFDNSGVYPALSADDAVRYQDYSSPRVDASTSINNRIVDVGIDEGEDARTVEFEVRANSSLIITPTVVNNNTLSDPIVEKIANDPATTGVDGEVLLQYHFEYSNTDPSGYLGGGSSIILRGFVLPVNKANHAYFTICYNTIDRDSKANIVDYINKFKPINGLSNDGGKYKFDMRAFIDGSRIRVEVGVSHPDFTIGTAGVQGEIVSANNLFPLDIGDVIVPSVKKGCTLTIGLELGDKFGRYYPVHNVKTVKVPNYVDITLNHPDGGAYRYSDPVKVWLEGKITSPLPSWATTFRFVNFGSDMDNFIQFPSVMPFRTTYYPEPIKVFDGYMHLKRMESFAAEAKALIPKLDVDSMVDIRINGYYSGYMTVSEKTPIFKTSGAPSIGNDTSDETCLIYSTAYTNPISTGDFPKVIDVRNVTQQSKTFGYTVSDIGKFMDVWEPIGLFNCFIRSTFNGKYFKDNHCCMNGSFEEMMMTDTFNSSLIGWGRPNIYSPDYVKRHLKGKIRNGGNYIENSNINNVARFELLDYAFVDDQYGEATQIYPVGQNLRIRQKRNSSTVYIGNIQSVSPDGATQTLQTSKFLGFVDAGSTNIGSKFGGYFRIGSQEFFYDDATSNIYRQSQAGTFSISGKAFTQEGSNDYKIHKLVNDLSVNNANTNVAFGYDSVNDLLLLTFLGVENKTIGFHYPTQRWLSFYSFKPENYVSAGVTGYYFENGELYKMNAGNRLPILYQLTSNIEPSKPKKFRSMDIIGDLNNFKVECTIPSGSNYRDMYTRTTKTTNKENKHYIEIPRNMKTSSNTPSVAEKDSGIEMRGNFATFELTGNLKLTSITVNSD